VVPLLVDVLGLLDGEPAPEEEHHPLLLLIHEPAIAHAQPHTHTHHRTQR
jgi:hypothetical protein